MQRVLFLALSTVIVGIATVWCARGADRTQALESTPLIVCTETSTGFKECYVTEHWYDACSDGSCFPGSCFPPEAIQIVGEQPLQD